MSSLNLQIKRTDIFLNQDKTIYVAGDKSISHRMILLSSLFQQQITLENVNLGKAVVELIEPLNILGSKIDVDYGSKSVRCNGYIAKCADVVDEYDLHLGESSAAARLLIGVLVGLGINAKVDALTRLRSRPMGWLIEPLLKMGANIRYIGDHGKLPVVIKKARLNSACVTMGVGSAQVRSGVLLACVLSSTPVTINYSVYSRDHTERLLNYFGAGLQNGTYRLVYKPGGRLSIGSEMIVPGDPSLAAYPIALHILRVDMPGKKLVIKNVCLNYTRIGFFEVLIKSGAPITYENIHNSFGERVGDIVAYSSMWIIKNTNLIDKYIIHSMIDEIPLLCSVYAVKMGQLEIKGLEELVFKETDRIYTTRNMLRDFGFDVTCSDSSIIVSKKRCDTAPLKRSFDDHRIAMSAAVIVAAMGMSATIMEGESFTTSYPEFPKMMKLLGYDMKVVI